MASRIVQGNATNPLFLVVIAAPTRVLLYIYIYMYGGYIGVGDTYVCTCIADVFGIRGGGV